MNFSVSINNSELSLKGDTTGFVNIDGTVFLEGKLYTGDLEVAQSAFNFSSTPTKSYVLSYVEGRITSFDLIS